MAGATEATHLQTSGSFLIIIVLSFCLGSWDGRTPPKADPRRSFFRANMSVINVFS